jgi:hypothetical protein
MAFFLPIESLYQRQGILSPSLKPAGTTEHDGPKGDGDYNYRLFPP